MSTVPLPDPKPPAGCLTLTQHRLLWMPPALIAGLFAYLCARKPDHASLLWTDPLGVKMLVGAIGLLLVGAMIFFGACRLLNRTSARFDDSTVRVIQITLATVWLCGFCLPTAFVLKVGPAAVQIQRNLIQN